MNRLFAFVLGLALAFGVRTAWTAVVTPGSDLASGDIGPALLDPADDKIRYSHQRPTTLITTNTVTFVGGDTVDLSGDLGGGSPLIAHGENGIYFSGTVTNTATVTNTGTNTVTNTLTTTETATGTATASSTATGTITTTATVTASATQTYFSTRTFAVTSVNTDSGTSTIERTFTHFSTNTSASGPGTAPLTATVTASATGTGTGTITLTTTSIATSTAVGSYYGQFTGVTTGTHTYFRASATSTGTTTASYTLTLSETTSGTETRTLTYSGVTATLSASGTLTNTHTATAHPTSTGTTTSTATATATTTDLRNETTILPPPVSTSLVSTLGFQRSTSAYSTVGVPSCIATNVVIPMDAGVSFLAHAEMYGSDNSASTSCGVAIGTCSSPSAYSYASPSTVYWNASSDYQATMPTCGLPADQNVSLFVCSYGGAGTCTTIAESLRITNQ